VSNLWVGEDRPTYGRYSAKNGKVQKVVNKFSRFDGGLHVCCFWERSSTVIVPLSISRYKTQVTGHRFPYITGSKSSMH